MEGDAAAKAWLWRVYQHNRGANRDNLLTYYRGQTRRNDLTPEILNMVNTAVRQCFPSISDSAPASGHSSSTLQPTRSLQDWDVDKPMCTTYLYYMVAEHLLRQLFPQAAPEQPAAEGRQFKGLLRHTAAVPACSELVACEEFHLPLVECAAQLVAFIAGEEQEQCYPWSARQLQREGCAATLWQAVENFQECFSKNDFPLPLVVQSYLQQLQSLLLDSAVLQTGSLLYRVMECGGGCHFQEGDASLAANILKGYAEQIVYRAQLVGWHAQQQQQQTSNTNKDSGVLPSIQLIAANQQEQQHLQQALPATFHEQCAWLMDALIVNHLDLCFGQHMSVVVACVVYVAAKLVQASLTFKQVGQIISSCVENTPADILRRTEVKAAQPDTSQPAEYGDVRMFYNARFLPAIEGSVRQYLHEYHQHNSAAAAAAAETEAAAITAAVVNQSAPAQEGAFTAAAAAAAADPMAPQRRTLSMLDANILDTTIFMPSAQKHPEAWKPGRVNRRATGAASVHKNSTHAITPTSDTVTQNAMPHSVLPVVASRPCRGMRV